MINIVCKGHGIIVPRMNVLAPINTPFEVSLEHLKLIIRAPGNGLRPFVCDNTSVLGKVIEVKLTPENYKEMYKKYDKGDAVEVESKVGEELNEAKSVGPINNEPVAEVKLEAVPPTEPVTIDKGDEEPKKDDANDVEPAAANPQESEHTDEQAHPTKVETTETIVPVKNNQPQNGNKNNGGKYHGKK